MRTLLVLGATSDIARATANRFAAEGWALQLAGRDLAALQTEATDLSVRHDCRVGVFPFDALAPESGAALWAALPCLPDALLCAVGLLGEQAAAQHDPALTAKMLTTNFTGLVPLLSLAADAFEQRGSGTIMAISSVAGDRGRASNYIYGSAKAGLTAFLSGLRNRLAGKGVHVLTIKPGFVATKMTEGLPLPPALTATPQAVAAKILAAYKKKKNVLYVRGIWFWIMFAIIHLPECIFKRTKI